MPAAPQTHASQAKIGRIVGFSLAGLWLAVSMLAAVANTVEPTDNARVASANDVKAKVVTVNN